MENFEPENVIRYDRWISWQDGDGVSQCVKASDYDKLLALYRDAKRVQCGWMKEGSTAQCKLESGHRGLHIWDEDQMTLAETYGTVEIK